MSDGVKLVCPGVSDTVALSTTLPKPCVVDTSKRYETGPTAPVFVALVTVKVGHPVGDDAPFAGATGVGALRATVGVTTVMVPGWAGVVEQASSATRNPHRQNRPMARAIMKSASQAVHPRIARFALS